MTSGSSEDIVVDAVGTFQPAMGLAGPAAAFNTILSLGLDVGNDGKSSITFLTGT